MRVIESTEVVPEGPGWLRTKVKRKSSKGTNERRTCAAVPHLIVGRQMVHTGYRETSRTRDGFSNEEPRTFSWDTRSRSSSKCVTLRFGQWID